MNRKINIKLFNESDEPVHFYKRHKVGCLDMRSAGYFLKSRADIAKTLGNHAMFLTDQETIDYLHLSLGIQPNATSPDIVDTASDHYKNKTDSTGLTPGATHVKPTHSNESAPKSNKPSNKKTKIC